MKRAIFVSKGAIAQGVTPMHMACINDGCACSPSGEVFTSDKPPGPEYVDVVRLLLSHGADPNYASSEARTRTTWKHFL